MAHTGGIPIVDIFALLRRDNVDAMRRALRQIRAAAGDTGMFYLGGHKIPPALLRAVYRCSLRNLELTQEFKKELSTIPGSSRYVAHRRAVFCAADPAASVVEQYYEHIFDLCGFLLQGCAMAHDVPPNFFLCLSAHPLLHTQLMSASAVAIQEAGAVTAHQPYGAITILWKDPVDRTHGADFEPETAESPAPGGRFSLRIADTMARWTDDLHISVPHRLIDEADRENYLIPVFYGRQKNVQFECAGQCVLFKQTEQFSR
jgi:isopenicillin N synthase-like dioxygenase